MKSTTLRKVAGAFIGKRELTIKQVAEDTGLSYNTVRSAMVPLNAEVVEGSYPARWTIIDIATSVVVLTGPSIADTEHTVAVDLTEGDDWIPRWAAAREQFTEALAQAQINPDSKPKELRELFAKGARSLASLAYALDQVSDKPDWFALLGGQLEDFTPPK